jgi:hypothetical protein
MRVIISGASNTSSSWPTWATIIHERYKADWVDVSRKGMGNEAIILRALSSAWKHKKDTPLLIVVMLTNVDKWDWYIDNPILLDKFNKEKHTITTINDSIDGGFWCTGSWFPLEKELFKEKYYNEDYFTLRSIQLISMFCQICNLQGWKYHIITDSPIWATTEQELIQGTEINLEPRLIKTELCQWAYESAKIADVIFQPSLIEFSHQNTLPWHHKTFGPHPGPGAHYAFTKKFIYPILDPLLESNNNDSWIDMLINRTDALWTQ